MTTELSKSPVCLLHVTPDSGSCGPDPAIFPVSKPTPSTLQGKYTRPATSSGKADRNEQEHIHLEQWLVPVLTSVKLRGRAGVAIFLPSVNGVSVRGRTRLGGRATHHLGYISNWQLKLGEKKPNRMMCAPDAVRTSSHPKRQ